VNSVDGPAALRGSLLGTGGGCNGVGTRASRVPAGVAGPVLTSSGKLWCGASRPAGAGSLHHGRENVSLGQPRGRSRRHEDEMRPPATPGGPAISRADPDSDRAGGRRPHGGELPAERGLRVRDRAAGTAPRRPGLHRGRAAAEHRSSPRVRWLGRRSPSPPPWRLGGICVPRHGPEHGAGLGIRIIRSGCGRAKRSRGRPRHPIEMKRASGPRLTLTVAMADPPHQDSDVTRRTWLAAERTWLAWWRSGVAVGAVALAVGRFLPGLAHGESGRSGCLASAMACSRWGF